jgi:hypothetical protein
MLVGSVFGIEVDVITWLTFDRDPFRVQCSAYTTRARIDDVSRVARFCLRLLLVSISFRAKRRTVSHKPFQSPVGDDLPYSDAGDDLPYSAMASRWAE